jgi:hypothetical protein
MSKIRVYNGWKGTICPMAFFDCVQARDKDIFDYVCSGEYTGCLVSGFFADSKASILEDSVNKLTLGYEDRVSDDWVEAPRL